MNSELASQAVIFGSFKNKTKKEIISALGIPTHTTACKTETGEEGTLTTWEDNEYLISLVFDNDLICLGVNKEVIKNEVSKTDVMSVISLLASIFMVIFGLYVLFFF